MSIDGWSWTTDRKLVTRRESRERAIRDVVRQLELHEWPREMIFGVRLALEEALVNAITHGNRSDTTKRVFFSCKLAPDRILLEIRDEGPGFDPQAVPDPTDDECLIRPNGRGLMLMRAYMSRVEYNEAGNCVVMEKHFPRASA
ncbi:MAG TPA: ATP-binding protein [Pirellulales bacterium]|jgi:serine/threonine-protein kinase RsbW|nr:ATP-binding protein [Pirellulales bacterium]